MNDEILRIQKMVAEGKITPEESVELIESVRLAAAQGRPTAGGVRGEPTVRGAIGDAWDAISRWPVSTGIMALCAVGIVVVLVILTHGALLCPLAFVLAGVMVYYQWRRRQGARAARQGAVASGGTAVGGAAAAARPQSRRTGFGVAGLILLAISLPVSALFVARAVSAAQARHLREVVASHQGTGTPEAVPSPDSAAVGGTADRSGHGDEGGTGPLWFSLFVLAPLYLCTLPATILGFIGWRSVPGKIAAICGLVASVLPLFLIA